MTDWPKAQSWELKWWNNCVNTLGEEIKQLLYAEKMGLNFTPDANTPHRIDMGGKSILDIGGGPASLLLKCTNVRGKVIDPLKFPKWVLARYKFAGIDFDRLKAEDMQEEGWDEAWIYNVLQHVENVERVIENIVKSSKLIRLFEWIDTPTNIGHIHRLTDKLLDSLLEGNGKIENLTGQNQCFGRAYYGIFIGTKT